MIAITSIASNLLLDQRAKLAVEAVMSEAVEVTRGRVARASRKPEKSRFKDCVDCGSDLRSEAARKNAG